ncbi:MAG: O-antigen ligase family protein [Clostridia bacterium]|nr:O-antigen ligase family protein [Clostridia bacterium]
MKINIKHNIIYTILTIYALFFNTERFIYLGIPIVLASYIILTIDSNKNFSIQFDPLTRSLLFILFFMMSISLVVILFKLTELGTINYVFKEAARLIIYIAIIQCMNFINISNKLYINVWRALLCVVVLVSIIQYTKIYDVNSFLKSLYGDSVQYYNVEHDSLSSFRSGSIFVNPNVCVTFLCSFLGMYLNYINHIRENNIFKILTLFILLFGILLTGSRTGMVVTLLLLFVNFIRLYKENKIRFYSLFLFLISCILIVLIFIPNVYYSDFRTFQFSQGLDNSISIKLDIWQRLLMQMNPINVLVGYAPFNYQSRSLMVDFDFGYFTMYYGLCGILIYFLLIHSILKYKSSIKNKLRKGFNINLLLIFIVFGLTASIYFNLRIFVLCELLFCVSFSNGKDSLV